MKRACDAFAANEARRLEEFSLGTTANWIKFAGQATRGHLRSSRTLDPAHADGPLCETG